MIPHQDLAALLPNLATVRRPSKSAIVNSSIALIHAHRRQRLLGARELRLLRCEGDALRRELNEWRDRAGLPRVEEPARSPEFFALVNAGEGGEGGSGEGGGGGEGWWAAPGLGEMGEEERRAYELVVRGQQDEEDEGMEGDEEEYVAAVAVAARAGGGNFGKMGNNVNNGANNNNNNIALQHIAPRFQQQQQQQQQMSFSRSNSNSGSIGGPGPALGFEGMPSHPALGAGVHTMYEPNGHPHGASHALPVHPAFDQHHHQHQSHHSQHSQHQHSQEQEKLAWGMNNGLYGSAIAQPQWAHQVQVNHHTHGHSHGHAQQQNAQALFTPPGTAGSTTGGGGGAPSPVNFTLGSSVGSLGALGHGHVYASPELDDASSVGSVERGGSGSGSVGGGSPGPGPHGGGSSQGSFDMMVGMGGVGGVGMYGRKPSLSLDVGAGAGWNGVSSGQLPIPVPVSAGGGGGGNGGRHLNAMMMMM